MRIIQSCVASLALVLAPILAAADRHPSPGFDTKGYLVACSSRTLDVPLQTPMLQLCVSTARELCNMGRETQSQGDCLADVTSWLEQDGARIESTYREVSEQAEAPSAFADLWPQADCSTTQVAGLNATELCAYQTALLKWFKLRVVERHQSNRNR
jgi:hypothetical protein